MRSRSCETQGVRLIVDRVRVEEVVARLAARYPSVGEDGRAAVEWLTAGEEDDAPAQFTRRRLRLFLWYELVGAENAILVAWVRVRAKVDFPKRQT